MVTVRQPTRSKPFPGAVDAGAGQVSFTLWAPGKRSVRLIGDFNGWDRASDGDQLVCDEHGLWTISKALAPGRYCYQFLVDDQLTIGDPYAREVEDGSPGQPQRSVVEVGQAAFEWKHDFRDRPALEDLIIYELHVGDFTAEGTFRAVLEKVDYLADLGVNAVEFLPVNETTLEEGWGYLPTYYFATRTEYGRPDDLRRLIDALHQRGIAVIVDMVLAHTGHNHPFNLLYPYEQSPWYGQGIGGSNQFGLPTLDHRKEPTRCLARDVQNFWLREYHVDGLRYDYAINIGAEHGKGLPFLTEQARLTRPEVYLIGECVPEAPRQVGVCGLHAAWHVRSSHLIKALCLQGKIHDFCWDEMGKAIGALDAKHQEYQCAREMVNYIESHDEERLVHELMDAGYTGDVSRRKLALGATLLMTMPGVPMIYHGQEFGETAHRSVNERNPLRWELLATRGGQGLFQHYRRMIRLRKEHPALRAEGLAIDAVYEKQKSFVFHRWNTQGDVVVVAMNFLPERQRVVVPMPGKGWWRELFTGREMDVQHPVEWEMDGNSGAIFVRRN